MRGVKRDIDWAQYDALMATTHSRREVANQMGLSESTLRSAEPRRGEATPAAANAPPAPDTTAVIPVTERPFGVPMPTPLSDDEQQALERAEHTIRAGLETFLEVGMAFLEIRDRRLYRGGFVTFEVYCAERWGMGRSHAYRAMDYAEVVTHLREASPIGDRLPQNEAQARPLAALPAAEQVEVWREAVETAPTSGITAAHVSQTAKARAQRTAPATPVREVSPIGDKESAREVSAIADTRPEPGTQPPKPKAVDPTTPARLAVQERVVALLQHIPDALAWPILESLVDEIVSVCEFQLDTALWNDVMFDEIRAVRALFPEPPKTKAPRSSRAQRWQEAVETLEHLQEEYQSWLDNMPENFQMSTTAELLQAIVDLDLSELLDVEHPQGFGRD
jgi:hypothetical protein